MKALAIFGSILVNIFFSGIFTKYIDDPIKNFVYDFENFMRTDKSLKEIYHFVFIEHKSWKLLLFLVLAFAAGSIA